MGRLPGLAAKRLPRATLTRQIPLPDTTHFHPFWMENEPILHQGASFRYEPQTSVG